MVTRQRPFDQERLIRGLSHLTRPPRLEGKVKEAMMRSPKKKKERL